MGGQYRPVIGGIRILIEGIQETLAAIYQTDPRTYGRSINILDLNIACSMRCLWLNDLIHSTGVTGLTRYSKLSTRGKYLQVTTRDKHRQCHLVCEQK